MTKKHLVLLGCGDVGPVDEPMETYSVLVRPTLATGDILFGQCERVYSERGSLQINAVSALHSRLKPHMASVFSDCGFNVVSVASNHAMDWGEDALLDTIALFQEKGIQTVGAGRNLEEARQPAFVERNGVRVAILAYCSVLNVGYAAGPQKTGIAPLRAHTYYEPIEYQAGAAPRVVTVPYEEDIAGMVEDIAKAKKNAHVVVLSLHWGIHFVPQAISDYQLIAAKAAFKAGADLILGHHAHAPKAIGVYNGRICFYSLSNFIMSSPEKTPAQAVAFSKRYGVTMDHDYPRLPYGTDAKRSFIAKAVLSEEGATRVSFLPVLINKRLQPEVLCHGDPRFDEATNFMEWASEGFDHKFTVEGNEVVITGV
jgi:hypothetical protein